jgi:hypothetical protein
MLILSPRSLRHLPVTESVVLPLLDQGAGFAMHSTQPTASLGAQREQQVVACDPSSSLIPVRFFITLKPKHFLSRDGLSRFLDPFAAYALR